VFCIKKICRNIETLDISHLKKYLAEHRKAASLKDKLVFMEADRRFHIKFTRLTENNFLIDTMQAIRDIMHLMGLRALGIEGRMQAVVKEHEKILSAISNGDGNDAMEQMEHHLNVSRKAVKEAYKQENTPA